MNMHHSTAQQRNFEFPDTFTIDRRRTKIKTLHPCTSIPMNHVSSLERKKIKTSLEKFAATHFSFKNNGDKKAQKPGYISPKSDYLYQINDYPSRLFIHLKCVKR